MKPKVFDPSRRHAYEEYCDICGTLDARMGTGGGNVPIVLESNQNHATAQETETSPTLPASAGCGGGYVTMIVDTLVFDEGQITCPTNGLNPQWGVLSLSVRERRTNNRNNPGETE